MAGIGTRSHGVKVLAPRPSRKAINHFRSSQYVDDCINFSVLLTMFIVLMIASRVRSSTCLSFIRKVLGRIAWMLPTKAAISRLVSESLGRMLTVVSGFLGRLQMETKSSCARAHHALSSGLPKSGLSWVNKTSSERSWRRVKLVERFSLRCLTIYRKSVRP